MPHRYLAAVFVCLSFAWLAAAFSPRAAASGVSSASLLPPANKAGVTYATDIRPLFETTCFRCHGPKRHRGDLRLDTLKATLAGGEHGKIVLPGDSARSPLMLAIAQIDPETAMPPPSKKGTSTKLTPEQIGLIRAWIDQGAK